MWEAAVAAPHDPSTHGLPKPRSVREARARQVRVLGEHLQVLTDINLILRRSRNTGPARGALRRSRNAGLAAWHEGEVFLRLSRNAGLARGPYGAAGVPDWLEGGLRGEVLRHSRNAGLARGGKNARGNKDEEEKFKR